MDKERAKEILINAVRISQDIKDFNRTFDGEAMINKTSMYLYGIDKIANAMGLTIEYMPIESENRVVAFVNYDGYSFCEVCKS